MPLERQIVNSIVRWIQSIPNAQVRKLHGTMYTHSGDPDIYGCINGKMFLIEAKQPGKQPTRQQRRRLEQWKEAGAVVGVAHSLDEAKEILHKLYQGLNTDDEEADNHNNHSSQTE